MSLPRRKTSKLACLLAVALACATSRGFDLRSNPLVILPAELAPKIVDQCSRAAPRGYEGTWSPSEADIDQLTQQLYKLTQGKAADGGRVLHPQYSCLQLVGLVIDGRQAIYINAYPNDHFGSGAGCVDRLVSVCDGGFSYWGAEYDVEAQNFLNLSFNGI